MAIRHLSPVTWLASAHVRIAKKASLTWGIILAYGLIGGLAYSAFETDWTTIDCFYFILTTMSTVGYGDISPSSAGCRVFTVFFIFVGIGLIFPQLSSSVSFVVDPLTKRGRAWLEKLAPQKKIDIDGDGEADFMVPRHPLIYYSKNLLPSVLLNLIVQFLSAAVFWALEEDWTYLDAFYHCLITATTVGYGDQTIRTQGGRLFAGFQIMYSVVLIGELISTITELAEQRKEALARVAQLEKRLDSNLVERLIARAVSLRPIASEAATHGLTELEYVMCNLLELEMVTTEQVRPFVKQFRKLDADGSGRLNAEDLQAASRAAAARSEAQLQSAMHGHMPIDGLKPAAVHPVRVRPEP